MNEVESRPLPDVYVAGEGQGADCRVKVDGVAAG